MEWDAFLSERPIAVLATVGADGFPHAVPVEVVVRDGLVYAWAQADSVKVRNVRRESRAALMAYKGNSGALVRGAARLIAVDDPSYEPITRAFLEKYDREETYGNDTLIAIAPERTAVWE